MQSFSDCVHLDHHPTARNQATATKDIRAGQLVISAEPLSTSLLLEEKGRRCDACHCLASSSVTLLKCSRCAAYWYCGVQCQSKQWHDHHRKLCKHINRFTSTHPFQSLSPQQRVDAILLSQLIATIFPNDNVTLPISPKSSPLISTFLDLLPQRGENLPTAPPVCTSGRQKVLEELNNSLFSRFGNNNFLLHSHLTSYAHGIFPVASRLFNHSCYPNSAARYIIIPGEAVKMEIVALKDIAKGEEINIPYLDPALPFETRQAALTSNYGFTCSCSSCLFWETISPIPPVPRDISELGVLEANLRTWVLPDGASSALPETSEVQRLFQIPHTLRPLLNSFYLPDISETFGKASHEGQYDVALPSGLTLLALYLVLYPPNFPQVGMHALEFAKTAWNALVTQRDTESNRRSPLASEDSVRRYLSLSHKILGVFGPEGDDGGPLDEIRVLQDLLNEA